VVLLKLDFIVHQTHLSTCPQIQKILLSKAKFKKKVDNTDFSTDLSASGSKLRPKLATEYRFEGFFLPQPDVTSFLQIGYDVIIVLKHFR
jgi:hypothetical protein